jgi:hypothetical protein
VFRIRLLVSVLALISVFSLFSLQYVLKYHVNSDLHFIPMFLTPLVVLISWSISNLMSKLSQSDSQ